jgi:hypothetical protein
MQTTYSEMRAAYFRRPALAPERDVIIEAYFRRNKTTWRFIICFEMWKTYPVPTPPSIHKLVYSSFEDAVRALGKELRARPESHCTCN